MKMRRGMVFWAPTEADMKEIRRRVSKERAKAAADLFKAVRSIFWNEQDAAETRGSVPSVGRGLNFSARLR